MQALQKKFFLVGVIFVFAMNIAFSAEKTAQDFFNEGLQAQNAENWYRAVESYQEAVLKNPAYSDAWFNLAQCTYQLGEYELALNYLQSAEKYSKSIIRIQNLKGMLYIALQRFDEARTIFNDILKVYPNDLDSRFGLAELDLFSGSLSGAEKYYLAALDRQRTNRNALLSLALVSTEKGNMDSAQSYINTALRVHSGDATVHYLASYIAVKQDNLTDAERQARAAVQIKSDYDEAYELLASILYNSGRYEEAIDICDYRIGRNKALSSAWYLKGLAQVRINAYDEAVTTFESGVKNCPHDEILRAAMELLITKYVDIEDSRRPSWASYHISKAKENERRFDGPQSRLEYQRALRIDPFNNMARSAFAKMLSRDGFNELYLSQLKFIEKQRDKSDTETSMTEDEKYQFTKNTDTIEALDSLMKNSISAKWGIQPFYLDKIRWKIGLYYTSSKAQLIHTELERITAEMAADIFAGVATTVVEASSAPVAGYGEAYSLARKEKRDYFAVINVDEDERTFTINTIIYSGRTGAEVTKFSIYRTGNDKFASALRKFRQSVLDILPVRGKVLNRDGSTLLVDLGRSEGVINGASFVVVKEGSIRTADTGRGLIYRDEDVLGNLVITETSEEISEGEFTRKGFYDRLNIGDEVILISLKKAEDGKEEEMPMTINGSHVVVNDNVAALQDTAPAADAKGNKVAGDTGEPANKSVKADLIPDIKNRGSSLISLIRSIY